MEVQRIWAEEEIRPKKTRPLTPEDVLRHYDEGGKNCPKYYAENEGEWERFIYDLSRYMEQIGGNSNEII